jgi:hypothetical protein
MAVTEIGKLHTERQVTEIPKCEWIATRWVGELLPLRLGHGLGYSSMFMNHFMRLPNATSRIRNFNSHGSRALSVLGVIR